MKAIKASVIIEIWAECPTCAEQTDLTNQENDFFEKNELPNPDRTDSKYVYYCGKCFSEFIVNELEY